MPMKRRGRCVLHCLVSAKNGYSEEGKLEGRSPREQPRRSRIRRDGMIVLSLPSERMGKCYPSRCEPTINQVGFGKVSPGIGPALAGKVPQPHGVPCRCRLRILFHQVVGQHEQGRAETVDVVHACEVEWEGGRVAGDPSEDPGRPMS